MSAKSNFYPPVGSRAGAARRGESNDWWNAILRERESARSTKNLTNSDRSENSDFEAVKNRWNKINSDGNEG